MTYTREKNTEYNRAWRERNPDKVAEHNRRHNNRDQKLWYKHKLTPLQYEELWESQDGKCYLCGDPLKRGRSSHIDHDHACCEANRSCEKCRRGIACNFCNWIVGYAQGDPARLLRISDSLALRIREMND